ncbi:hypothetical protein [Streptomyces sp. NPDC019507]|uniref:hypothetical protein n=1 Tax=Streptomyces sp. NPDC019507 TaxID=3154689 RepID=UPI00340A2DF8
MDLAVSARNARSAARSAFPALNRAVVDAVRAAGSSRLVVVGGAGSLEVAPGRSW